MSPSLTVPIEMPGQHLVYDLHAVIYIVGIHFTARVRDSFGEWWKYDGMWKNGAARRNRIQVTTDLLRDDGGRAAFFIYRRGNY
jgi:hypothetical protein